MSRTTLKLATASKNTQNILSLPLREFVSSSNDGLVIKEIRSEFITGSRVTLSFVIIEGIEVLEP